MPPAQNPPALPPAVLVLASYTVIVAMIAAWSLAIGRLGRGEPLIPRRPARAVPWGPGAVLAAIMLYLLINVAVLAVYVAATGNARRITPATQLVLIAANNAVLIAGLLLLLRLTSGARFGDLGLGTTPARADALRGVGGYLLAAPLIFALLGLAVKVWPPRAHPLQQMLEADAGVGVALLAFLSGVVLAPAAEELLFRGVILGGLGNAFAEGARSRMPPARTIEAFEVELLAGEPDLGVEDDSSPRAALGAPPAGGMIALPPRRLMPNLVTSFLFAALHYAQWPAPIPLFFFSLALGWLYQRTGGLIAPFAMHATFNGMSTAILYLHLLTGTKPPGEAARPAAVACLESTGRCRFSVLARGGGRGMIPDPFPSSHGVNRLADDAGPGRGR